MPLLPHRYKIIGISLLPLSLIAAYFYYFGGKPGIFNLPVFAIVTSYLETRTMVVAQTNILDEVAVILFIISLIFIGFSSLKNENDDITRMRMKSLLYSVYISSIIWIISIVLIFGWAIFISSSFVFILFLVLNILIFNYLKFINHKIPDHEN